MIFKLHGIPITATYEPISEVAVTIYVPIELWNQLGGDPEAAIIRAIEASLTKECV